MKKTAKPKTSKKKNWSKWAENDVFTFISKGKSL